MNLNQIVSPYLLEQLDLLPRHQRVVMLLRHSIRYPIITTQDSFNVGLTPQGIKLAEQYGALLGERFSPGRLAATPVGRCLDTTAAIARGAGWNAPVQIEPRISFDVLQNAWDERAAYRRGHPLPVEVSAALGYLWGALADAPGLDVVCSHDSVLGVVVQYLTGEHIYWANLPNYLEAVCFWRENTTLRMAWRRKVHSIDPAVVFTPLAAQ
jgi:broad specificity phosphatase PhoE